MTDSILNHSTSFESMANKSRHADLVRFYTILTNLETKIGGARKLASCSGRMDWPKRGVYFFFEQGENRSDTGNGLRVVRVGTHALKVGSGTKLWTRLSQHRGQPTTGGGNHRGSIFKLIVGAALINRDGLAFRTWGNGNTADKEVRDREIGFEPPPLKWSDLKYVFWHQGGPICRGRDTSLKRSSRSCGRWMCWSRKEPLWPMPFARLA